MSWMKPQPTKILRGADGLADSTNPNRPLQNQKQSQRRPPRKQAAATTATAKSRRDAGATNFKGAHRVELDGRYDVKSFALARSELLQLKDTAGTNNLRNALATRSTRRRRRALPRTNKQAPARHRRMPRRKPRSSSKSAPSPAIACLAGRRSSSPGLAWNEFAPKNYEMWRWMTFSICSFG